MADALTLDSVSKAFGGLQVIEDLSFSVPRGSRTALIGPNGAGKTTVFNLISGVYIPDSGRILIGETDAAGVSAARRVGLGLSRSFQNIRLMPHLSAVENVMLGEHHRRHPLAAAWGKRATSRARAALADAGLDAYEGMVVSELPYGIQKRIEVVRALLAEPSLLLLDEPAAGLNGAETDELRLLLERVSDRGVTILVVEHDMPFVHSFCNHVVVLNFGRKIYDGDNEGVRRDPAVLEAYLGSQSEVSDAA
ncbi:MAG: ABC transporter ATP-binding protein [Betaproteobacteria bacterium]|nr:ABC transporter ATP-binding protein [Betaproteobacteria bacterium]